MALSLDLMRCAHAYVARPWFFQSRQDPDQLVARLDTAVRSELFNLSLLQKLTRENPWMGRLMYWLHSSGSAKRCWEGLEIFQKVDVLQQLARAKALATCQEEAGEASSQGYWQWSVRAFNRADAEMPLERREGVLSALWNTLFPDRSSYNFGVAHLQGRRPSMEDEHLIEKLVCTSGDGTHQVDIAGIADGHGGRSAATFIKKNFSSYFRAAFEKYNRDRVSDEGITAALQETCIELDRAYGGNAGSTLSVAVIVDGDVWTCNLGDARAVISNGGRPMQLSADQKCNSSRYRKKVEARGGQIINVHGVPRVGGMLAIPAAIGDHGVPGMVHEPTVRKVPREEILPGSYLIVACDGLWDVCSSSQAASYVHNSAFSSSLKGLAQGLVAKAYNAGSTDNISALVLQLS